MSILEYLNLIYNLTCPFYFNAVQVRYAKKGPAVGPNIHLDKVVDVSRDELNKMFSIISLLS